MKKYNNERIKMISYIDVDEIIANFKNILEEE
jgi:hypothetical protein